VHPQTLIRTSEIGAVIFDMDGVVTGTAVVHAAARKQPFDAFPGSRAAPVRDFKPFDVDGKPRYEAYAASSRRETSCTAA
jgi:beta-phosphoglucomutase-like phosphatase (HAD superfamily)